jgi:hypothetical protein
VQGELLDGLDLSGTAHTAAGSYPADTWTFADVTDNYNAAGATVADNIGKADADCSIVGYSGIYDGVPHGASGTCSGVGGESPGTLDLGLAYTDVPGGMANWALTGNGNYHDAGSSVAVDITPAGATCAVAGWSGTYDGLAHGASGACYGVWGDELDGLDLGDAFTNVPGGTAHWTLANGNYSPEAGNASIAIAKALLTVTADDQTRDYGEPDPAFTFTYDGFATGEDESVLDTAPICEVKVEHDEGGTYPIACSGGAGANYDFSYVDGTLTVEQTVATGAVTVVPSTQQYSDLVTFAATLSPASAGGTAPATEVTFYVGTQSMGTVDLVDNGAGSLVGTLSDVALLETVAGQMAPGARTVTAEFGGVNENFTVVDATTSLTIGREDARITYIGDILVFTASPNTDSATVLLAATIRDITAVDAADANAGDIRKATVRFVNRDNNTVLCTAAGVTLVDPADSKTGTAGCEYTAHLGGGDGVDISVGVVVDGYYTRDSSEDNEVLTVSKPLAANFITGGGHLVLSRSAGQYAGDTGSRANFGFNVKYNKSRTNLQGHVNLIFRRTEGEVVHTYQIKSTSLLSLAVDPNAGTATFTSRANLQDVTDPYAPVSVYGGGTLRITLTDGGEPGSSDTIGFQFLTSRGALLYSSNWDGTRTVEQVLNGGNLVVH